jgi:hypothetical protein
MMHINAPMILRVNDSAQRTLNTSLETLPFFFSKKNIISHPTQIIKRARYSKLITVFLS